MPQWMSARSTRSKPVSSADWVAIIGAVGAAAAVIVAAIGAVYLQARQTHQLVNSRMTQLLELTQRSALAQGELAARIKPSQDVTST